MLKIQDYLLCLQEGIIMGSKCSKCDKLMIPIKPVCSKCGSFDMKAFKTKGRGVLNNFTIIYVTSDKYKDKVPYAVALIKLDEGEVIMGRLIGVDLNNPEGIKLGTKVKFEPLVENDEVIVAFRTNK